MSGTLPFEHQYVNVVRTMRVVKPSLTEQEGLEMVLWQSAFDAVEAGDRAEDWPGRELFIKQKWHEAWVASESPNAGN